MRTNAPIVPEGSAVGKQGCPLVHSGWSRTLALSVFRKGGRNVAIAGDPPMRLLLAFQQLYPAQAAPEWVIQAPGREMWAAAARHPGHEFTIGAPDLDARVTFSYRSARGGLSVLNRPLPRWARYAAGALLALRDSGVECGGLLAAVMGSEPPGPRYEHAVGIAVAALACSCQGRAYTAGELIELVERVRREYVEA